MAGFRETYREQVLAYASSSAGISHIEWRPFVGTPQLAVTAGDLKLFIFDLTEHLRLEFAEVFPLDAPATGIGFCGYPKRDTVIAFQNDKTVYVAYTYMLTLSC